MVERCSTCLASSEQSGFEDSASLAALITLSPNKMGNESSSWMVLSSSRFAIGKKTTTTINTGAAETNGFSASFRRVF